MIYLAYARNYSVFLTGFLSADQDHDAKDGERLPLAIKDMGPCEMFPQTLSHNPNGRYDHYCCIFYFFIIFPPVQRIIINVLVVLFEFVQIMYTPVWLLYFLFLFSCILLYFLLTLCFFVTLCHRFVVVCGDGEYIIYTAMALRNKSFGSAQEFVWASDSSEYVLFNKLMHCAVNLLIIVLKNFIFNLVHHASIHATLWH